MTLVRSVYCQQYMKGKKIPECYMLGGVVRSEILSKDMVIISAYELERDEENSLFSQEHGNTGLSALRY